MPEMMGVIAATCCLAIVSFVVLIIAGFDSLEYQEMGLSYSWISEVIEPEPYASGRHWLGIGCHFIKFPKMVQSINFVENGGWSNDGQYHGPSLTSRTNDGLSVQLEMSFQYKLDFLQLYDMYTTFGDNYQHQLVRMAIEQLTTATTRHPAHFFFTNRSQLGFEMHDDLKAHFNENAFCDVPFFQLRTIHLPSGFEQALKETQSQQQTIAIARLEQKSQTVTFQTEVLKAEQAVKVMMNEAEGEAASIKAQNDAFCQQYKFTQELQSEALESLMASSGWTTTELMEYLRLRAVREHRSDMTTINL